MSTNKKNKLIPKLRFPEFQKDGEWEVKRLGEIGEISGNGVDKINRENERTVFLLNYLDVYKNNFITRDLLKQITTATNSQIDKCRINKGDIFFTPTSEVPNDIAVSSVAIEDIPDGVYSYHLVRLRLYNQKDWDLKFRTYVFKIKLFSDQTSKLAQGSGTRYVITLPQFKKIQIPVPSLPEQQKIAACLSSLDELIQAEEQKLEALKKHKKGLLQNLFPQEGETLPKLRFKEFKESGEWEETTLSQVADYENGKAHEQDIKDIGEFIVVNSKFISSDGEVKKFTNIPFCLAKKGDILMVLSDVPNGKAIAKCFFVDEDNRYTVNQRICRIIPYKVNSKILYYLLNRNPYFLEFDDGVNQTNLRKEDVLNCPIMLPRDQNEQQKIADCLSSLDEFITAQTQKIECLQQHKKGLLQGLFPAIVDTGHGLCP